MIFPQAIAATKCLVPKLKKKADKVFKDTVGYVSSISRDIKYHVRYPIFHHNLGHIPLSASFIFDPYQTDQFKNIYFKI